jgi:hypothetical protein
MGMLTDLRRRDPVALHRFLGRTIWHTRQPMRSRIGLGSQD